MGMGWDYEKIDRLTLPDALDIFRYWREWPPVHELVRNAVGYEKPMTLEEKIKAGAMGPMEFLEHYRKTGGKVPGLSPN